MVADTGVASVAPLYRVEFTVSNDWGAGFVGEISITNDSAEALPSWRLAFDAPFEITNLWNGVIRSHDGNRYVVENAGWNGVVQPGATVTFGFQAGPLTDEPSNFVLNGVPLDGGGAEPEPLPNVTVADAAVAEGDDGGTPMRFGVALSAASDETVTVAYEVRGGTAAAGEDFAAAGGVVTFQPGETAAEIVVEIFGDTAVEGDETLEVVLSNASGAAIQDGTALGTITNDDQEAPPPPVLPSLAVADGNVVETDTGGGGGGEPAAAGFFSTSGNQIVDSAGNAVKIAGVNWFGLETTNHAPHGLWARGYQEMMDQIKAVGFNTVRLPFSNALFEPGSVPNGIDFAKNPDLQGLSGLEIMDKIVAYAGQIGLRIVLDNHRITAGNSAQESGLWYGDAGSEQDWIDDWVALAQRYAGDPTVIGADLFNEPHGPATWGDGGATDWARAATAAGNAVHAVNPDWLILVEGIGSYQGDPYWWGGHLGGVRDHPIDLNLDNKLVYAPHAYPNSVFAQPWFSDPSYPENLPAKWTDVWGYIYEENIAPVLLGEFGSKFEDPKDVQWMDEMLAYLGGDLDGDGASDLAPGAEGMSWTWWSWNPNSGDTGGILQDDWRTVNQAKVDRLEPLMFDLGDGVGGGGPAATAMVFEVSLNEPAADPVSVSYRTEDDTALAGEDYEATSGTLTFAPGGELTQTVSVPLKPGGDGRFKLLLGDPVNATLADGEAIGAITESGGGGGDPIGDPTVPDDAIALDFTVRDDWNTGFVADMTVTNNTDEPVDGWRFLLEMPNDIVNIWNAEIAEDRGDAYVIENADWNGALAPGATASLGFQGTGDIDVSAVEYAVIA